MVGVTLIPYGPPEKLIPTPPDICIFAQLWRNNEIPIIEAIINVFLNMISKIRDDKLGRQMEHL